MSNSLEQYFLLNHTVAGVLRPSQGQIERSLLTSTRPPCIPRDSQTVRSGFAYFVPKRFPYMPQGQPVLGKALARCCTRAALFIGRFSWCWMRGLDPKSRAKASRRDASVAMPSPRGGPVLERRRDQRPLARGAFWRLVLGAFRSSGIWPLVQGLGSGGWGVGCRLQGAGFRARG